MTGTKLLPIGLVPHFLAPTLAGLRVVAAALWASPSTAALSLPQWTEQYAWRGWNSATASSPACAHACQPSAAASAAQRHTVRHQPAPACSAGGRWRGPQATTTEPTQCYMKYGRGAIARPSQPGWVWGACLGAALQRSPWSSGMPLIANAVHKMGTGEQLPASKPGRSNRKEQMSHLFPQYACGLLTEVITLLVTSFATPLLLPPGSPCSR